MACPDGRFSSLPPGCIGRRGQISWVVLLLAGAWLVAVTSVRRQYVATLRESISQHRLDVEQASAPVLDRSTTDLLALNLSASDPSEILYALSFLKWSSKELRIRRYRTTDSFRGRGSAESRRYSFGGGDKGAVPEVERCCVTRN